jgi:dipeptidyl-peptidase-4
LYTAIAAAEPLTVQRIFSDPDLSGPSLREPKFSPDGRWLAYLRGKAEDKHQLDLWASDTRTGRHRLLVDLRANKNPVTRLTRTQEYETDARLSPRGRYVSFIRDQDLFVIGLESRTERALTTDGEGTVRNGEARVHRAGGDGTHHRLLVVAG